MEEEEVEAAGARRLARYVERISYKQELTLFWFTIRERRAVAPLYQRTLGFKEGFYKGWLATKGRIRTVAKLLGIPGMLFGLMWLTERSTFANYTIKAVGTLVLAGTLLLMVLWPVYRMTRNPWRIFKWVFDVLGIEVPAVEEG